MRGFINDAGGLGDHYRVSVGAAQPGTHIHQPPPPWWMRGGKVRGEFREGEGAEEEEGGLG